MFCHQIFGDLGQFKVGFYKGTDRVQTILLIILMYIRGKFFYNSLSHPLWSLVFSDLLSEGIALEIFLLGGQEQKSPKIIVKKVPPN